MLNWNNAGCQARSLTVQQLQAEVAELADAHGSGPCTRKGVGGESLLRHQSYIEVLRYRPDAVERSTLSPLATFSSSF